MLLVRRSASRRVEESIDAEDPLEATETRLGRGIARVFA